MKTPPDPAVPLAVPALTRIGVDDVPTPLDPPVGVVRVTVPLPTSRSLLAEWVMEPPVVLPPVLVATVIVPPEPVVMSVRAAVPVPPPAALTLIVTALAPVLVMTTDEVWELMRGAGWVQEPSVHLAGWPERPEGRLDDDGRRRWDTFLSMRRVVMKALEAQRSRGVIGGPLEARVTLAVQDAALARLCEAHRETLAEAFVVSGVDVQADGGDPQAPGLVEARVERAPGKKCARCWKHLASVGSQAAHPALCERWARVVTARPT
jgi:hypothetical protein